MLQNRFPKFIFLFCALLCFGLSIGFAQTGNTVLIKDMAGREVRIPAKVQKVVGIEAGALRILVYLEAAKMVAGVEDTEKKDFTKPYLMAHPELAKLPTIGPMHGGDAELIAARKPEVIFWTSATKGSADSLQQRTGIPVVVLNYGDLDNQKRTFYEALRLTAKVLNKRARAEQLIGYIETSIKNLGERTQDAPKNEPVYVGGVNYRGSHESLRPSRNMSRFAMSMSKTWPPGLPWNIFLLKKNN
jgi:iron complex transport system substrate-binding protein